MNEMESDINTSALLHFSNVTGNLTIAFDSSGNENNGTIFGAKYVEGIFGEALKFDGLDDYVDIPNSDSLQFDDEITIEAWIKTNESSINGKESTIVSKWEVQSDLSTTSSWTAYDAGNIDGLDSIGCQGVVFDGRYIYFVPMHNTTDYHGTILRYDTTSNFTLQSSWSAYDASFTSGMITKGYTGGTFDGRYVYFVPREYEDGVVIRHGRVLRYDTENDFTNEDSWTAYDAGSTDGLVTKGYTGAVYDGKYIYFVPHNDGSSYHGKVLRYNTSSVFNESTSWSAYDASSTSSLTTIGYDGGVFDGRYIYFVPHIDGATHGKVLRYDTNSTFNDSASWTAYDAGFTSSLVTEGYVGGVFDGRYVYFVPYSADGGRHGRVLRYDTFSSFTSSSSWVAYDAGSTSGLDSEGYSGVVFDGKYIYFVPEYDGTSDHGKVLRFDTTGEFTSGTSWTAYDAGSTSSLETKGYNGAVSDGRYIYFAPLGNSGRHGRVLRYDTISADASFKLGYSQARQDGGLAGCPIGVGGLINTNNLTYSVSLKEDLERNTWHYLAMTYDGSYLRLYIDGQEKKSAMVSGAIVNSLSNLRIGNFIDSNTNFNGIIDEVRISDVARSDSVIFNNSLNYRKTGELLSNTISLPAGKLWNEFIIDRNEPTNCYINISIIDNSTGEIIPGFKNITENNIDLSNIHQSDLKIRAIFNGDGNNTPGLYDWMVTWTELEQLSDPLLNDIENNDFDGNYTISWSGIESRAIFKTLEVKLPQNIDGASSIWDGQNAYIFGGDGNSSYLDTIVKFNPFTENVTILDEKLPKASVWTSAIWDGEHAYIFGGYNKNTSLRMDDIVRFNPVTKEVITLSEKLPSARDGTSAVYDGKYAYIFGGHDSTSSIDEIIRFDPISNITSTLSEKLIAAKEGTASVWDGTSSFIFGGDGPSSSVFRFNISIDHESYNISTLGSILTDANTYPTSVWDDKYAYIIGGINAAKGKVFRFDTKSYDITELNVILESEFRATSVWTGNETYIFGGYVCDDIVKMNPNYMNYALEEDDNPSFTSPTELYCGNNFNFSVNNQSSGKYYYRVKASNASGISNWSNIESVNVIRDGLSSPTISGLPQLDDDGNYSIEWTEVEYADNYTLEEDDNNEFTTPSIIYHGPHYTLDIFNKLNGTYYYRVKAENISLGESEWSSIVNITVLLKPILSPTITPLTSPDEDGNYTIYWSTISNADNYTLEEDDNSGFTTPLIIYNGSDTSKYITNKTNGTYYYRVKAENVSWGESEWSNIESIIVEIHTPPQPDPLIPPTLYSLTSPDDDGIYTISWSSVSEADNYSLEEDDNNEFTSSIILFSGNSITFNVIDRPNGTYFYRIKAVNDTNGDSNWSNIINITVDIAAQYNPILSYNLTEIDFGIVEHGFVGSKTIEIWNSGSGLLIYYLNESINWLEITPNLGNSSGEHDVITFTINTTTLGNGSYELRGAIQSNGGNGLYNITVEFKRDYKESEGSNWFSDQYFIIIPLSIGLIAILFSSKFEKRVKKPEKKLKIMKPIKKIPIKMPIKQEMGILVKSALNYEHAHIIYKVKIENNSKNPLGDIRIEPFFPLNMFAIDDKTKSIALIKPGEAQTSTFKLRPIGECGNVEISAKIGYYDYKKGEHDSLEATPKETQIICPMLKRIKIDENNWTNIVDKLIKIEESTEEIPISSENLFSIINDVIKDLNLFMLDPVINKDDKMFRGVSRFYCEGVKGLKYCVKAEVIGGSEKSKLILKAFAENEQCLIGFYHCLLDEIEKRTNIKDYITEAKVIQHIYGDYIGKKIDIKDSVIHKSEIK
jgi:hypothetical protein